jgi:hypothetical protein
MSEFQIDLANADRLGLSSEMSEFKIDPASADRLGLSSQTLKDEKWLNWLFS